MALALAVPILPAGDISIALALVYAVCALVLGRSLLARRPPRAALRRRAAARTGRCARPRTARRGAGRASLASRAASGNSARSRSSRRRTSRRRRSLHVRQAAPRPRHRGKREPGRGRGSTLEAPLRISRRSSWRQGFSSQRRLRFRTPAGTASPASPPSAPSCSWPAFLRRRSAAPGHVDLLPVTLGALGVSAALAFTVVRDRRARKASPVQ